MSTALAEATALAQAALAAGLRATFVVDNIGTVNRARASLADLKGDTAGLPGMLRNAERLEIIDDTEGADEAGDYPDHVDPLQDADRHGRPSPLIGPSAAASRITPKKDGATWRSFQEAARARGMAWEVVWCPSHLLDKTPPKDTKQKYEKAKGQEGWKDEFMKLNLQADEMATAALKEGSGLHEIAARERALETAQAVTADIIRLRGC